MSRGALHRRRLRTGGPRVEAAPALSRTTTDKALARLERLVRELGARRAAPAWLATLSAEEARAMAGPYALAAARRMEADLQEAARLNDAATEPVNVTPR